MTEEQRLMIAGMDMLKRKFIKHPDDTTFTVKELIEESNKVYDQIIDEKKIREYYRVSDGFFTYYVNNVTGEKKFKLDDGDVEVERKFDDFVRNREPENVNMRPLGTHRR